MKAPRAVWLWLVLAGLGATTAAWTAAARPRAGDDDDEEERAYQLAVSRRLWEENCLMCHAAEMTTNQRLTPKQWAAEVDKMIGWGAPVPPDDKGRLIDYLARQYPADAAPATLPRLPAAEALALDPAGGPAPAQRSDLAAIARGAELYAAHCASCHARDARGGDLGTNLVEAPVLLQPERYERALRAGLRRMPSFATVLKPADESALLAWLQQQTGEPAAGP